MKEKRMLMKERRELMDPAMEGFEIDPTKVKENLEPMIVRSQ
jgi:hypothetical protein